MYGGPRRVMKLTVQQARDLVRAVYSGESIKSAAVRYGVGVETARTYCYRAGVTRAMVKAAKQARAARRRTA